MPRQFGRNDPRRASPTITRNVDFATVDPENNDNRRSGNSLVSQ